MQALAIWRDIVGDVATQSGKTKVSACLEELLGSIDPHRAAIFRKPGFVR
jgi:hypothetical protein